MLLMSTMCSPLITKSSTYIMISICALESLLMKRELLDFENRKLKMMKKLCYLRMPCSRRLLEAIERLVDIEYRNLIAVFTLSHLEKLG